ncbi:myosin-4-like [Haliotis rufescens]|uniref:myosin-4-like n=1 Tax=Haliotis rufescens TaxID=6454 RepID=UPI00201FAD9C|nr:myosin-4-like [Haliotis rufescens]
MGFIQPQLVFVVVSFFMGTIAFIPPPPAQMFINLAPVKPTSSQQEEMRLKQEEIETTVQAVNASVSKLSEEVETWKHNTSETDAELSLELESLTNQQKDFQNQVTTSVDNGEKKDKQLVSSLDSIKTEHEEFKRNISEAIDDAVAKDDELSSSLVSISTGQNDFKKEITQSVEDVVKKDEEIVSSIDSLKKEQGEFKGTITKAVEDGDIKVSTLQEETGQIKNTQGGLITKIDELTSSLSQTENKLSSVSTLQEETGQIKNTQGGLITKMDELTSSLSQTDKLSSELEQGLQAQKATDEKLESMVEDLKKQLDGIVSNPGSKETTGTGRKSCKDILSCGRQYPDAEYWLYPPRLGGERIKVWCHDMAGTPQEYITLPNENHGDFPNKQNLNCQSKNKGGKIVGSDLQKVGKNNFEKIKIDINTMVVDREDRGFVGGNGARYPYGFAGDCYSNHYGGKRACGPLGSFKIDTRGTGLIVNPNLTWKAAGNQPFAEVLRSENNRLIRVVCGGGCGYCEPVGNIVLERIASDEPVFESAADIMC